MQFETKIIDGEVVDLNRFIVRLRSTNLYSIIADEADVKRDLAKHATYCFAMTGSTPMAIKLLAKSKQLDEDEAERIITHVKSAFVGVLTCAS